MHGSECVARFVCEDLPCRTLIANDDIGARDRAVSRADQVGRTQTTHPRDADLLASRAASHEGPVRVAVGILRTPFGEFIQSPGHVSTIAANIPWQRRSGSRRTRLIIYGEIAQTDGDVERILVQARCRVDQVDDPILCGILGGRVGFEVAGHFTVRRNTNQRDLLGLGASRGIADGISQIHTGRVSCHSAHVITLAEPKPKQRIQRRDSPLAIRLLKTKGKDRVRQVCIKAESVRRATRGGGIGQRPLEFGLVAKHVGIPVDDHVVAASVLDININRALFGQICRLQLDMVFILVDTERTLEQRLGPVLSYCNPSPAYGSPSSLARADQRPTAKDSVFVAMNGFALPLPIGTNILNISIVGENVVVWLELQLDPLSIAVQFEGEIKM